MQAVGICMPWIELTVPVWVAPLIGCIPLDIDVAKMQQLLNHLLDRLIIQKGKILGHQSLDNASVGILRLQH